MQIRMNVAASAILEQLCLKWLRFRTLQKKNGRRACCKTLCYWMHLDCIYCTTWFRRELYICIASLVINLLKIIDFPFILLSPLSASSKYMAALFCSYCQWPPQWQCVRFPPTQPLNPVTGADVSFILMSIQS